MIGIDHEGNVLKKMKGVFFKLDLSDTGFFGNWIYEKTNFPPSIDDCDHIHTQYRSWRTVTGDIYLDENGIACKKLDGENPYRLCLDDRNGAIWLHSFFPTSSIRAFTIATPEEIDKVKVMGGRAANKVYDEAEGT